MNGAKSSPYEGGVRAPFFVRWPGVVPAGGVVDAQVSHVDLLPTFCELAGVDLPTTGCWTAAALVPLLQAGEATGIIRMSTIPGTATFPTRTGAGASATRAGS
jgi:arylsulfatase A-like enzyme